MKLTRFAAIAALAIGTSSPLALHADGLTTGATLQEAHSTRTNVTDDMLNRLRGTTPRFDYTMWLHPELQLSESTVEPSLGYLERIRRMEEATIYLQNSSATTEQGSSGSGVIIDNINCWALTNHHVIEGADFVNVSFINGWLSDGTPQIENVSATIIGYPGDKTQDFDLALIQLDHCDGAAWAPVITDHTLVQVGETAVAVGNPMSQTWSVTTGTVSHTSRMTLGTWPMLQTDASVNPGNSGGPLFDQNGEVIGINTSILSRQRENNGLAFAVRSDLVRLFLNNMYRYGQMQVNQIGIQIGGISKSEAAIMDIPGGVLVSKVIPDTPAAEAGIQEGDIITHVDGTLITSQNRIIMQVWSAEPNIGAHARILREQADGTVEVVEMTIPVRNVWESDYTAPEAEAYDDLMGWTLQDAPEHGGVLITEVAAMGPAHRLNMEPSTTSENLAPSRRVIDGRQRIVKIKVDGSVQWAITGVKAQGQARLDLSSIVGVAPNARADALEAYIRGAGGKPVVLSITILRNAEITATTVTGSALELSEADLQALYAEHGISNNSNNIVLYAQPEAYTEAPDLDNWTPPATGN